MKWCSFCEKEVSPTGKLKNICPVCKKFVSAQPPKAKSQEPTNEFNMGFSGAIEPEHALRFQKLRQAGIVRDANDVFVQGLVDMEARHLPTQQAAPKPEKKDPFADIEQIQDMSINQLMAQAKAKSLQNMLNQQGGDSNGGIPMQKMMEFMMMERLMDRGQGSNPEIQMLKDQLAARERDMERMRFEQQMSALMAEIRGNRSSGQEIAEKIDQLRRDHETKLENMRAENQRIKDESWQRMIAELSAKVSQKSEEAGWTRQIQDQFQSKAMEILSKQFDKGLTAAEPEKGTGEIIADVLGKTATALAPILSVMAQRRQQPAYVYAPPYPPEAPQAPGPEHEFAPAAPESPPPRTSDFQTPQADGSVTGSMRDLQSPSQPGSR